MDPAGENPRVAGTVSDYAAIVDRHDFTDYTIIQKEEGAKPYWATTSDDGEHCRVSWSGTDSISAIHYDSREEVAQVSVSRWLRLPTLRKEFRPGICQAPGQAFWFPNGAPDG